ncbi:hypothetical protein D3C81_711810 [compost metagenome]
MASYINFESTIRGRITETLSNLDFIQKYHVEVRDGINGKKHYKVRIWIIENLYTAHILLDGEKIDKLIRNIAKGYSVSIDVYHGQN